MKEVINGKKYDTDTAEGLGYWENIPDVRDFHHEEVILYKKKTGEYFLLGFGGPATSYAKQVGQNEWSGGHRFRPITEEEAREWAYAHLDVDRAEALFGEVAE